MTETELLCAEQQDRIVDLILRKASYRSLRESDCWHAGAGALISSVGSDGRQVSRWGGRSGVQRRWHGMNSV